MSSDKEPVYTEKTKCRDCYKCVRNCPVKAIKVEDNSARIIHELCIYCGRCVYVCPAEAKKVRNDVPLVRKMIQSSRKVVLSLAPSWSTGVFGTKEEMFQSFASLGFSAISETALGAEIISDRTVEDMKGEGGLNISSACPSVVELIRKYYPERLGALSRQPSPLDAHCRLIRKLMGENVFVVFAGPCIAKKLEADSGDTPLDAALTFDEILAWMDEEKGNPQKENQSIPQDFIPCPSSTGSLYAMEGGMIESITAEKNIVDRPMVPLSGVVHIIDALEEIEKEENMMLELLSCPGGCVNGSGFRTCGNQFSLRKKSLEYYSHAVDGERDGLSEILQSIDLDIPLRSYKADVARSKEEAFPENEIEGALRDLGKTEDGDMLNCGGCGYNSCRDFAIAILEGMGENEMCVTNMRKRAQKKVDMLLRTLPMGVVIVNRQMQIVECNSEFASLFAPADIPCDEEYVRNHFTLPLANFIDLETYLELILSGDKNLFQERIKFNGKFLKVSFFSIEETALAGVILQDITSTSVKREDVIKKAEEVINKNLQNVQQIASLLGENAAETEIILRSLTDQFQFTTTEAEL